MARILKRSADFAILEQVFYRIENCAKNRATSSELLKIIKWFGSGSGHWPLFCEMDSDISRCAANAEGPDSVEDFGSDSGLWP